MASETSLRFQLADLLEVGALLAGLQCVSGEAPLMSRSEDEEGVLDQVQRILDDLARLELRATEAEARSALWPVITTFQEVLRRDPEAIVGPAAPAGLAEIAVTLLKRLKEESESRPVFVVPDEADHFTQRLLNESRDVFGIDPNVWNVPEAEADIEEAAQCYAIGRSTAASMFACRVAECFGRALCTEVRGGRRLHAFTLGKIIEFLRRHYQDDQSQAVIRLIDDFRKRRNQLMHPDAGPVNAAGARADITRCAELIRSMSSLIERYRAT